MQRVVPGSRDNVPELQKPSPKGTEHEPLHALEAAIGPDKKCGMIRAQLGEVVEVTRGEECIPVYRDKSSVDPL
jgi:hypothetical protein